MKAFTPFPKSETTLRQVLRKLQDLGTINCSFQEFNEAYVAWHLQAFPKKNHDDCVAKGYLKGEYTIGDPKITLLFRSDWFADFVQFLCNYEVEGKHAKLGI